MVRDDKGRDCIILYRFFDVVLKCILVFVCGI